MIEAICKCVNMAEPCKAKYEMLINGRIQKNKDYVRSICNSLAFPGCTYCKGQGLVKIVDFKKEVYEW